VLLLSRQPLQQKKIVPREVKVPQKEHTAGDQGTCEKENSLV
jgi:hypothetical protein